MKRITASEREYLGESILRFKKARKVIALTGAGISVESGIEDFRSRGGLWSQFAPEEYATLQVFRTNPEKSWQLFRALGRKLVGKRPNDAHMVVAALEKEKNCHAVVTQNIDNLHQMSGSQTVFEIHGDHHHLQCIDCGDLTPIDEAVLLEKDLPQCQYCKRILKPNVVLFGENVRSMGEIVTSLQGCDILLVIGTSAQVYPAAALPDQVKNSGGLIYEFNTEETVLSRGEIGRGICSDYFFHGKASVMLRIFYDALHN